MRLSVLGIRSIYRLHNKHKQVYLTLHDHKTNNRWCSSIVSDYSEHGEMTWNDLFALISAVNGTLHALEVFYPGCDPAVRSCCTKYRSTNPRLFLNEQVNFYCNVRFIVIFTTNDCSCCQVMSYIKVRRECCWLLKSSATLTAKIRGLLFELLALPPFVPFLASPAGLHPTLGRGEHFHLSPLHLQ